MWNKDENVEKVEKIPDFCSGHSARVFLGRVGGVVIVPDVDGKFAVLKNLNSKF
jgi:hypothetical protein